MLVFVLLITEKLDLTVLYEEEEGVVEDLKRTEAVVVGR